MSEKSKYYLGPAGQLLPVEEKIELPRKKKTFTLGVPREIAFQENRVSLSPDGVGILVQNGIDVIVQSNAGKNAHFFDHEYIEAGATIVETADEVYQCDVILKVAPMLHEEIDKLRENQMIFSALHVTMQNVDYFKKLIQHKVTAIALEFIKDNSGFFPVLVAMSEITGMAAVQIASELLSRNDIGKGKLFGAVSGISPCEVVIIGAGTVGTYIAKAALGFGAEVKVFDNQMYKLRRLQMALGRSVFTSIIHPKVLTKALKSADVVFGALHSDKGRVPIVITEEMVREMKAGSVIIDVSIDQGGCSETSRLTNHNEPYYVYYDVIHYCVPNIPSKYPQTASYALSNFFTPLMVDIADEGGIEEYLKASVGFRNGVYLYKGKLVSSMITDFFGLPHQPLDIVLY
ncbi:MAG: alanine dehydrogenase [Bacteroidales bacterium]|nr:alanine dehydrogenase [Bacteroidales bacterium]